MGITYNYNGVLFKKQTFLELYDYINYIELEMVFDIKNDEKYYPKYFVVSTKSGLTFTNKIMFLASDTHWDVSEFIESYSYQENFTINIFDDKKLFLELVNKLSEDL